MCYTINSGFDLALKEKARPKDTDLKIKQTKIIKRGSCILSKNNFTSFIKSDPFL